jgi:hypothetical protein
MVLVGIRRSIGTRLLEKPEMIINTWMPVLAKTDENSNQWVLAFSSPEARFAALPGQARDRMVEQRPA